MKTINKTSLAIAFSVLGAMSSMSAIAMAASELKEHRIEIVADSDKDVQLFVSVDGDMTKLELPKDALQDKAQLEAALASLPDEVREKVAKQLGNIHLDAHAVKIHAESADVSTWVDGDAEQVFVFKTEESVTGDKIAKKIVKHIKHDGHGKVIEIKRDGKVGPDLILKLLEKGEFSVDDLDKIQQALDAKR